MQFISLEIYSSPIDVLHIQIIAQNALHNLYAEKSWTIMKLYEILKKSNCDMNMTQELSIQFVLKINHIVVAFSE